LAPFESGFVPWLTLNRFLAALFAFVTMFAMEKMYGLVLPQR